VALKSEVHIGIVLRAGVNILHKAYCTQPFKVLNITENTKEGILRCMLMSSSPGILDGDNYDIRIDLGNDCAFELQTQSFQRLFSMKKGAVQNMLVHLQKDAHFKYLPHPVVPHGSSDFVANNKIFLSEGGSLIWGEVFTCGRKLNGESFRFTRYHAITEIFLDGRLIIKENLFMQPGSMNISGMGQLEGFTHQATLIFIHPTVPVKELISILSGWLDKQQQIIYGITCAPVNGIIMRLLGNKAEQLFDCLKDATLRFPEILNIKL
jgi:urease accessory protein